LEMVGGHHWVARMMIEIALRTEETEAALGRQERLHQGCQYLCSLRVEMEGIGNYLRPEFELECAQM